MITFEKIANIWLENISFDLQYTYQAELKNATNHLVAYFGERICGTIKGLDVDEYIRYLSQHNNPNTGKPYSKRVFSDIIDVGCRIFDYALENDLIDCRNPFYKKKRKIPKNAPKKERTPIDDIQKDLVLKVYNRTQIAALIMLFCGLRRGEIIPLEWSDIDFLNKQIAVTKSVELIDSNNYTVKPHTKNGKDRYVSIPDNIIPYLKLEKYNSKGCKYIYSQKCGKIHTASSWKSGWKSYQTLLNYRYYCDLMKKKEITPKPYNAPTGIPELVEPFTAHQLRHTYCTMLYLAGVDLKTASKLMGHSDVKITLDIYTHLDEKYKRLNIDKFNNYIANDTTNQILDIHNQKVV